VVRGSDFRTGLRLLELDETTLVTRLRAGDEQAFDDLVGRLHPAMLRFARALAGDGAEEVVQDTWAAVIDGLQRFEGRSTLKTWIFGILSNRAKTWAARARRSVAVASFASEASDDDPAVDPARFTRWGNWSDRPRSWIETSPEEILLRMEAGALLAREIDALPAGQRTVVTLRDVEGFTAAEVCDILEIGEANQRVLLHRGRSKLRAAMERHLTRTSP
jgi:RNA polymerase sigma-70 factor, ECF subfamily